MKAGWTLAALASCAVAGTAIRTLPAATSEESGPARPSSGREFRTNIGDAEGRLVRLPGCTAPFGVALIPGYLSGIDYAAVDWSRGPAAKQFWFGSRRLTPGWARIAATAGQALFVAGRAVGLPALLPPYAIVTFVPTSCGTAPEAVLTRATLEATNAWSAEIPR